MTRSHNPRPVEARDFASALEVMRRSGLRVSAARRLVVQALYDSDEPVTAERIASGLGGELPRSDLTSVYRNLERLEEIGLVRHFHVGHGPGLYARAGAVTQEFLLCEACGSVRPVRPEAMEHVRDLIRAELGHEARFTHFPLAGLCAECAARERSDLRIVDGDAS